jgi:hypothetical protein
LGHNWSWNWFPQRRKDSPCCWHVRQTHTSHGQKFDYSIPILRNGHQFINWDEDTDYKDAHHGITHMRMLRTGDGMVRKRSARNPLFQVFCRASELRDWRRLGISIWPLDVCIVRSQRNGFPWWSKTGAPKVFNKYPNSTRRKCKRKEWTGFKHALA